MKTETYEIIIETLSSALSLEKWRREEAEARVRELKAELAQKEKEKWQTLVQE